LVQGWSVHHSTENTRLRFSIQGMESSKTQSPAQTLEFVGIGTDELSRGRADKQIVREAVEDVYVVYHLAINWDGASWKHEIPVADLSSAHMFSHFFGGQDAYQVEGVPKRYSKCMCQGESCVA
jgi:hypothetical protein